MLVTAITFQLGLLFYYQVTTLFDFYPFGNECPNVIRERLVDCGVNGLLMAMPPIKFYLEVDWVMAAALVGYLTLLPGDYLAWWQHFLFGPSATWQELYNRLFKETILNFRL